MVHFRQETLEKLFAPGISKLTKCEAIDISENHPEAKHWLANLFLNSLFGSEYKNKYRQYAINQIHRAQVAFADYLEARQLTLDFLERSNPNNPATRLYFRAISRWESCLLSTQIFIDLMNKMKKDLNDEPVFIERDGSAAQRAYDIANIVKHWGLEIHKDRHGEKLTIPVWLTNNGLKTQHIELTYIELAALISEIAGVADALQNPNTLGKSDQLR